MKFQPILCLIFLLCIAQSAHAQQDDLTSWCNRLANAYLEEKGNEGLIIAVLQDDSISYFSYGSSTKDSLHQIQANDIFEIGSVTKLYTGIAIRNLIAEGKLYDTSRVNNYLPKESQILHEHGNEITIAQLLSHYSGFPKTPINFNLKKKDDDDPYRYYTQQDFQQYLALPLENPLWNKEFQYSHINYALLGMVIEYITKMKYEDYIDSIIFQKLNIHNTTLILDSIQEKHYVDAYRFNGTPTPHWTYSSMESSLAMKSTAYDFMLFIRNYYDPQSPLYDLLHKSSDIIRKTNIKYVSYAYGWQYYSLGKRYPVILTHNGGSGGHRCYIGILAHEKKAVVVLSNSANAPDQIGIDILSYLINH